MDSPCADAGDLPGCGKRVFDAESPRIIPQLSTPGGSGKRTGLVHPMMSSPSPAPKMTGGGRNDLFRAVMGSPYPQESKSYTPMSATPSGLSPRPVFKTPLRSGRMSPVNMSTPKDHRPPPGQSIRSSSVKKKKVRNPFEAVLLEQLDGHVFMSPGVFSVQSTPSTDEKKPFRWSIEHMATLYPADIDEKQFHHQYVSPDHEVEERAQKAIEKYFSSNLIAPSPWSEGPPKTTVTGATPPNMKIEAEMQGSIQKQLPVKDPTSNKLDGTQEINVSTACQTMLSLPVNFDVESVLGQYMMTSSQEEVAPEVLSTSSLRRKLFFQCDTSAYAVSPVKGGLIDGDLLQQQGLSPFMRTEDAVPLQQATPLKPPSRSHACISSSPIKRSLRAHTLPGTPDMGYPDSPQLSPIVHGYMSRRKTSGLFTPHDGSFVGIEDIQRDMSEEFAKPLGSPELSPIKADLCVTPAAKERSKPDLLPLSSPGMSPICAASPRLADDEQGSYIEEDQKVETLDSADEEDERTPHAASSKVENPKRTIRKISHLTRHKYRNALFDFNETPMDFDMDTHHPSKHLRFAEDIKTSSFAQSRDFSSGDIDMDDNNAAPNSTNQDTGYQTASLQSTNHDTGVHATSSSSQEMCYQGYPVGDSAQHTNITSLFSKMPLDSLLQDPEDGDLQLKDLNDSALDTCVPVQQPLIDQILDVTNPEMFGHGPYNEEEILERARKVLEMANRLYPENKSNMDHDVTSKIMDRTGISLLHELEPIVSSTPHKPKATHVMKEKLYHTPDKNKACKEPSASDQALAILRRAGEDLAKFGHLLSSIKLSVQNSAVPTS
ncbi:hypothetical protein FSP39_023117 [Pinctada imbricata]|uniref:Protein aurora borealis n=1 Tax=Pinctada imbricata TaxID=66713 RepID=A0AA88YFL4_PINIB|nr:hypothetical protein FSP39_023117 [Pinctada imbricata]